MSGRETPPATPTRPAPPGNFIVAASSLPPPKIQQPFVIVLGSIVLISGRTVKMSKSGTVPVSLICAGSQVCKGKLALTTADPVRITARKIARLGNARFKIKPQGKKLIRVRLSKTARKLVKRLHRVRSRATIREIDLRGNPRISLAALHPSQQVAQPQATLCGAWSPPPQHRPHRLPLSRPARATWSRSTPRPAR